MKATLTQIVDPSLSIQDLEESANNAFSRSWEESLIGKQTKESYQDLMDEGNAYLYIAWLKERGFTVSR